MTATHPHSVNCSFHSHLLFLLAVLGLFSTNIAFAQSPRAGTGEVISLREITLKPGVDAAEFEKWAVEYFNPALEGLIPGIKAFVARGDRGVGDGKYAYIILFDSYNTRKAYMPEVGDMTDYFREIFFEPNKHLHDELFEYAEQSTWGEYTDWVVLR